MILLGNAPTSWGVEDAVSPANPPWLVVLEEVASAGYDGIELGPYGYMPTSGEALAESLVRNKLALTAGTVMQHFEDRERSSDIEDLTHEVCRWLARHGARYVVLIDALDEGRISSAGRSDVSKRIGADEMSMLCRTVNRCGEIAQSYGLHAVFHSHAGTHVEYEDELVGVMSGTDPEFVGLCLDTGHATYAGIDPIDMAVTYKERLEYLHIKDVDPIVLQEVTSQSLGFWDAYRAGVFCPVGEGKVDLSTLAATLKSIGYGGWLTVEQDADPSQARLAEIRARKSLNVMRSLNLDQSENE